jgi:hypothetical protein
MRLPWTSRPTRFDSLVVATLAASGCLVESGTTPTPPPPVHAQGTMDIAYRADLDRGIPFSIEETFRVRLNAPIEVLDQTADVAFVSSLGPTNGARLAAMGTTAPGRSGCAAAILSDAAVGAAALTTGTYVCVLTNGGRYSEVRIVAVPATATGVLRVAFTTYE